MTRAHARDESRCRVCGRDAGLSFRAPSAPAAFDGSPAKIFGLDHWLTRGISGPPDPGPRTLCATCSEHAADWYVPEYAKWARFGARAIADGPPDAELDRDPRPTWTTTELFDVKPARFLRQVVTILLAIAPPGLGWREHPELSEFARDPERTGLPPEYQFYLSLYRGPFARFVGYSVQLDAETKEAGELLELAYPPFSCVLSLSGETGIETTNVSDFAGLTIDETCVVDLDLLDGFGHTPLPADFRTLAAVERDRAAARRAA